MLMLIILKQNYVIVNKVFFKCELKCIAFYRSLQGSNPQAGDITAHLNNTLSQLIKAIQDAVVRQLADDFVDVTKPLLPLTRASLEPPGY